MMEISMDDFSPMEKDEFEYMYKYIETIESGAFGTVIKALDLHNQKEVAVKIISKNKHKKATLKQIEQEVEILERIHHENIVRFETFKETKTKMYIVMEYCSGGSLKSYLEKYKNSLTETQAKIIINSLLSAVNYLHQRDICHRDIKPENIILKEEGNLNSLKLIDFGLSAQYFEYKEEFDYCGTLLYMAPEQIHNKTYSKGIDIWSVGIILFKLLNDNQHPLWTQEDNRKTFIVKLKEQPIHLFRNCSEMSKSILMKLLERDPSFRYTAQNALEHPWISGKKYDPIPKTVFERLKIEETKKKLLLLLNTSLFLAKFDNKKREVTREYQDCIKMTRIKDKEQFIYSREREFLLKKEPSLLMRPATQNGDSALLFKLNRRGTNLESPSKGPAEKNPKSKVLDNSRSSTNSSEPTKNNARRASKDTNDPLKGYMHYPRRASKQIYNPIRNMSISKKSTFNTSDEPGFGLSPNKNKKSALNHLMKYKMPFQKSNEPKLIQKKKTQKTVSKTPLLLPKI